MRAKIVTMSWEEAPDTITPEDLSNILGIGIVNARNLFKQKGFPKVSKDIIGNQWRADKEAVRLYIQGKIYVEYRTKAISNKIQNEILETLKEIKEILGNTSITEKL